MDVVAEKQYILIKSVYDKLDHYLTEDEMRIILIDLKERKKDIIEDWKKKVYK